MSQREATAVRQASRPVAGKELAAGRTRLLLASLPAVVVGITVASDSSISFSGTDSVTGKQVATSDYAGTPLVVNVWGSWCSGCVAEVADLEASVQRHPEMHMIGIDLQDTKGGARRSYRRWGWRHPSVYDLNGEIAYRLGLQGTPTTFFLDKQHRIVARVVGASDLAGFEKGLDQALAAPRRHNSNRSVDCTNACPQSLRLRKHDTRRSRMHLKWKAIPAVLAVAATALVATSASLAADKPGMKSAAAMMSMDTGAKLTVLTPRNGAIVTGNSVATKVAISNFKLDAGLAGTPDRPGVGHYHIELDGSLVNMYGATTATISLQNVAPGKHTLKFLPAVNEHGEDMKGAKEVSFVYKPAAALPQIGPKTFPGKPSLAIVSPKPGATVSGSFDMTISTRNFVLSSALYGKANVAGYGHWHVNLDSTNKGMMGMATMMGMSGTPTFHVSLAGVKPGKHRFWAILVDNTHAPTIGVMKAVTLNVK